MILFQDTTPESLPIFDDETGKRHILIVDDDVEQAEVLAEGLSRQGFNALIATTASTGLMAAQLHNPDLVILDIRLPDGSGLEVCERLSDSPQTGEIPVIVVSACEGADVVRQARSAGCQYFVSKPYDPNALLTLVNDAIENDSSW